MGEAGPVLIGIDIGATGIKVGAFDTSGTLLHSGSRRNGPVPQPGGHPDWRIWDVEAIWRAVSEACSEVTAAVDGSVVGVSVTGFGADGIPLRRDGTPTHPMISWHCGRTAPQRQWLDEQVPPRRIYGITGYHNYAINTLNRWRWLRENAPAALDAAHCWLMVQDYIVYRLTGQFTTEATIASTTMAYDLRHGRWSEDLLQLCDVPAGMLPAVSQPGSVLGQVQAQAAEATGLPVCTPVATGGHDCEIGAFGSGITTPDAFVDITGTWEMVVAAVDVFAPTDRLFAEGIDYEQHTVPQRFLCQGLMLAGGAVEWVLSMFYSDVPPERRYAVFMAEAEAAGVGASGVVMIPALVRGMGAFQAHGATGTLLGLNTTSTRGQVARAVLEACCYQLRKQATVISEELGLAPHSFVTLGGATRNPLWLQMKADVTQMPVQVPQHAEITLLGAAMLAGVGAGVYAGLDEAVKATRFAMETFEPDEDRGRQYDDLYHSVFMAVAPATEDVNRELARRFTG